MCCYLSAVPSLLLLLYPASQPSVGGLTIGVWSWSMFLPVKCLENTELLFYVLQSNFDLNRV